MNKLQYKFRGYQILPPIFKSFPGEGPLFFWDKIEVIEALKYTHFSTSLEGFETPKTNIFASNINQFSGGEDRFPLISPCFWGISHTPRQLYPAHHQIILVTTMIPSAAWLIHLVRQRTIVQCPFEGQAPPLSKKTGHLNKKKIVEL